MRIVFACLSLCTLSACGLSPMYAGGGSGAVAQSMAAIEVAPIEGRAGWLVRSALEERFGAAGMVSPQYRIDVRLDDQLEGLAVLRDDTISRERRTLRCCGSGPCSLLTAATSRVRRRLRVSVTRSPP